MKSYKLYLTAIALFIFNCSIFISKCEAQYSDIYNCQNPTNGWSPNGSLLQVGNKLYGTMTSGGSNDVGVIFSYNMATNVYTDLYDCHNPTNGWNPRGSLILVGSKLYGTMSSGGTNDVGVIFSLDTNTNVYTNLYDCQNPTNGWDPNGSLLQVGNKLYGTMSSGGANDVGVIFSYNIATNVYTDLYDCQNPTNGWDPDGSLILVGSKLYGTMSSGGANDVGVIFSLDTNTNGYTDLYDCQNPTNGWSPNGSLLQVGDKLYGTMSSGGANDVGVIFSYNIATNVYTDLYDCHNPTNGWSPYGSLILVGSQLYGTMSSGGANDVGVIFSLDTNTNGYTDLYDCQNPTNGWSPNGSLLQVGNKLYGTMSSGGTNDVGVLFSYTLPCTLTADGTVIGNIVCNGGSNGIITTSPGGGLPPYTYTWSDANTSTTATVSNLSAGTYSVNVQDASGCSATASVSVTQPNTLNPNVSSTHVTCNGGDNGSATATPNGGTPPYSYQWSDANTTTTATLSNLTYGTYTVNVTDVNNCSASASVFVSQPATLIYISAGTISNVTCNGSNNGHVTVTAIGGTPPFTYTWSNGVTTVSTTQSPNTMSAGSYTVMVSDSCGNSHTATAMVTQPGAMRDSVSTQTNTPCGGGNGGCATIGAKGGTYPYQYMWSNGSTLVRASSLSAGTYSVVVTDQHGCTNSVTGITITQPNPLILNLSTISYPQCHAEITGGASITESGGTGPYTYTWSPAASTTNTAMNIAAGSYTVTVKDAHRCTASLVVVITQPAAIHDSVVKALTVNVACKNGSTGSATIGVKYGTAPYTYLWGANTYYTSTVTGLSIGTYSITVEDANGCQSTVASLTITQPSMVQLDSVSFLLNTACYGGDGGEVSIGTRGGVSPYTYGWSDGKTGYNVTGLTAGTYSLIITDKAGCSNTVSSITITQPSTPVSSTINTNCIGNDMGTVTIGGSGGTPGYNYLWSNGKTTTSLNVANGTYTVKVSDSRGCSATNSVTVSCGLTVVKESGDKDTGPVCCGDGALTNINLYPNPNSGQFTIQLSGVSGQWSVEIYSVLGQKVYSQSTIHQAQTTINLSNQPNGIYLIRILDNTGTLVGQKKVVKTN